MIGAALAVSLGNWFDVHAKHRRLILLIGLSAGFSAAFKTPLGAAFVAIEILYRDMSIEAEALIYTIVSAVVAYVVAGSIGGWESEFLVSDPGHIDSALQFTGIALLGVFAGLIAAAMPTVFFTIRNTVQQLPLPYPVIAVVGGLAVGLIGLIAPQTIGDGSQAFALEQMVLLPAWALVLVALGKLLALSITLGAGGVGGVLSPSLLIGAVFGAAFAQWLNMPIVPTAIVGMGTIFAAAARVPIGTLLMVSELTGGYELLPATALAVAISYLIQFLIAERLPYPSIHGEQPPTFWNSPAHQDQVLEAGIGLLQRGGIELPDGLQLPDLRALLSMGYPIHLGHGGLILFTADVAEHSDAVGKSLAQNPLGHGVYLLEIRHGDVAEQPQRASVLQAGDTVV